MAQLAVKAIIFDFGQTLVDSAEGFRSAEKTAKEKLFLNMFPHADKDQWESFLLEYRQVRKRFHDKSQFSRFAIWQAVYDRFNCKADSKRLTQMETEYWELVQSMTTPFPETIKVLEKLVKQFKLGIITNTQGQKTSNRHRIKLFPGIEKFFETIIVAGESEIPAKPDPQPFLLCLEKMNIKACEAIYVGDDFQKDVLGAGSVGINPIWLKHSSVKRSWPDPETVPQFSVITDLNKLLEMIRVNRLYQ
ncbi:MAG: HAD-IA family hydrolase [Desulfobacula sp.]|jgi:putative hydrolase of the HAD superfamily|uniref:HAD family hydrolase n=1 Tax=Desulfobacula sp. TaxID=2593537 RepID=UPI001D800E61|nr:HAD-IA family hydrolase [Desulfobacula sp.]MBT3487000.1 HAD-IA family hydrolase [Desulfobacula sp.]MBT3806939.1 HAD-IA family hydrolase [Desulfobacula sp.]MBT4027232.1 HAD-IA family hydrolase [Desulfobacula sp.]MBT4197389.1 HAD-IA family hydrolase [Desulfobacula sp.]